MQKIENTHQITEQNIQDWIKAIEQGDTRYDFFLNIVLRNRLRQEAKTNPLPLPAPIQTFHFRDKAGLEKWERWVGHKTGRGES